MFNKEFYINHRAALKKLMHKGLAIFVSNDEAPQNYPDNTYHYRQDSNFAYLFGLNHPDLVGVVDFESGEEILFGQEVTIDDIIWCGPLPSLQEQGEMIGIKDCRDINRFPEYIREQMEKGRMIHITPQYRGGMAIKIANYMDIDVHEVENYVSQLLIEAIVSLREIKSDIEIQEMDKAADTAYFMQTTAMKMCKPGVIEQRISGAIEGIAIARGGIVSFPNIVSQDGQTLHNHYHGNILKEGRMMVCDCGAETENYLVSDFTRTTPVGGKFNSRQKDVYEIVLKANMEVAKNTKPGIRYMEMHKLAVRTLIEGLQGIGLMKGNVDDALAVGAHFLFMPHGLGHMLGMDVHDMEGLGEINVGYNKETPRSKQEGFSCLRCGKVLKPGFVVTDEPGCYFIPTLIDIWKSQGKHKDFINYDKLETFKDFGGIRIEDDLLITETGNRILGKPIPKTVEDVERCCAEDNGGIHIPGVF